MIHKMVRVLQETFLNDHLVKKDDPPKSSTTQRMELRLDITQIDRGPHHHHHHHTSWCIDMLVAFLRNNLHLRYLSLVKAPSHECRLPESRESAMQRQSLVLHACQRARQPPDIVSRSALRETFLHRWFGAFCRCVPLKLGCVTPGFVQVLTAAECVWCSNTSHRIT